MKRINISDSLAWLGGADKDTLAVVPQERARFVQMALVLLTTASIAVVSMMFAMNDGVKVPLAAAIAVGIFWGFVILNLDRYLVLSMGHVRTLKRMLWMALPRLLLAAVISLVIAAPLTLRIFQHDINVQVAKTQATESSQMKSLEAKSLPAQEADQVQKQINSDKSILAGHLPINVSNPQLQDDQAQVNQLQPKVASAKTAEIDAYEALQCELYGDGAHCANASDKAGNGPIAQAKQAIYEQNLNTYNALNQQLQTAQSRLNSDEKNLSSAQSAQLSQDQAAARKDLPIEQAKLAGLTAQVQTEQNSAQSAVNNDSGILAQLSALSAAGAANSILKFAQLIVTLLFFLIEILPVTVKLLLNLAPPTAYDKVAESQGKMITDQVDLKRIAARRDTERESNEHRKREDGESRVRINVADDMRKREEALGVRANEHVANEMQTILDAQLGEWARQVRSQLGLSAQPNALPNGAGPHQGNTAQYGNAPQHGYGNGTQNGNGTWHGNSSSYGGGNGTGSGHAALGNVASGNGAVPDDDAAAVNGGQPETSSTTDFGLTWDGGLL
jgi:hypothetical protein